MIVNFEELEIVLEKEATQSIYDGRNKAYTKGMRDATRIAKSLAFHEEDSSKSIEPERGGIATMGTWWYECGACKTPIDPSDQYCRKCGRKINWEKKI